MFWIQGKATMSLIKIEILFCRGRYYIGGGQEPLIATVEGNTDSGMQRHLGETRERERGVRKGWRAKGEKNGEEWKIRLKKKKIKGLPGQSSN